MRLRPSVAGPRVRIRVGLLKGKRIEWPRFENSDSIMAVGAYRPLEDALRIAQIKALEKRLPAITDPEAQKMLSDRLKDLNDGKGAESAPRR